MGRASRQKKLKKELLPLTELKNLGQLDGLMMNIQKPGAITEDWRKADQEYFKQHPTETVYIRHAFPGEIVDALSRWVKVLLNSAIAKIFEQNPEGCHLLLYRHITNNLKALYRNQTTLL